MGVARAALAVLWMVALLVGGAGTLLADEIEHYGAMVDRHAGIEECVACHDGSIAKAAVYCIKDCSLLTPHSVLRRYPPPGREAAYRPVESLREAGIVLVDGMVVCVSCHNLGNPPPYHLAVESVASRLCLTCHIQ